MADRRPATTGDLPSSKSAWGHAAAENKKIVWWLRTEDPALLKQRLPAMPDRIVLTLDKAGFRKLPAFMQNLKLVRRRLIFGLPPIIQESDLPFFAKSIKKLVQGGFRAWQVGHLSQVRFFEELGRVELFGDYTLNILNSESGWLALEHGLSWQQLAIETDRANLEAVLADWPNACRAGLTVYGTPPLFTARLTDGHFRYDRMLVSPKNEKFRLRKWHGLTLALPERPFDLLGFRQELMAAGLHYLVVDISHQQIGRKELERISQRLTAKGYVGKAPSFNYRGTLI